jgi:Aminoglycoside-2''-adenylyltransferase
MDLGEVLGVLADLTEASCAVWVAGGWGVDALIGQQTWLRRSPRWGPCGRRSSGRLRTLARQAHDAESPSPPPPVGVVDGAVRRSSPLDREVKPA